MKISKKIKIKASPVISLSISTSSNAVRTGDVVTLSSKMYDKKVKEIMEKHPYLKTYEISYWGAIYEPMTWFNDYIGFVRLVAPSEVLMGGNYHFNLYFRQDITGRMSNFSSNLMQDLKRRGYSY